MEHITELEYLRAWKKRQEYAWLPCGCSHGSFNGPLAWSQSIYLQGNKCQRCCTIVDLEKIIFQYENQDPLPEPVEDDRIKE